MDDTTLTLEEAGVGHEHRLTAIALEVEVVGTFDAFAAWCRGDDRILTSGLDCQGGNCLDVRRKLRQRSTQIVDRIYATFAAFAAIMNDGSVCLGVFGEWW